MPELALWIPDGTPVSLYITQSGEQGMIFIGEAAVKKSFLRACPHCSVSFKTWPQGVVVRLGKSLASPDTQGIFCPACNQEIQQELFEEGSGRTLDYEVASDNTNKQLQDVMGLPLSIIIVGIALVALPYFFNTNPTHSISKRIEDSFLCGGPLILIGIIIAIKWLSEWLRDRRIEREHKLWLQNRESQREDKISIHDEDTPPKTPDLASKTSQPALFETVLKFSPPSATDEDEYLRRCLMQEFHDEPEVRTFRSDPAFSDVLTPLNSQRYSPAIIEAKKLLPRYEDFDLVYKWLGAAYRETQQLGLAQQTLREGISKSKRKHLLLTDLGETEWLMGKVEDGLYWLSQALHCLAANPTEYTAYLFLSYLANGIAMRKEADLFLARVDQMRAGQIRLSAPHAERLMRLCREGRAEPMRKVIRELADKRLS